MNPRTLRRVARWVLFVVVAVQFIAVLVGVVLWARGFAKPPSLVLCPAPRDARELRARCVYAR